jgi:hypothetical protein
MNKKCQSEEDVGNAMDENECRLIGCEGLSSNSLRNVDLLHCKYEELKPQIAGKISIAIISFLSNIQHLTKSILDPCNCIRICNNFFICCSQ